MFNIKFYLLICFLTFCSISFAVEEPAGTVTEFDLTDGLVAFYPFNGNSNDESGNSNNGVVYNAILSTDRFGASSSAYSLDGDDDYIDVQHSEDFNFQDAISIAFWIKRNEDQSLHFPTQYKSFVLRKPGSPTRNFIGVQLYDAGHMRMNKGETGTCVGTEGAFEGACNDVTGEASPVPLQEWTHYVFTIDEEGNTKLYENGVHVDSGFFAPPLPTTSEPFRIGMENNANYSYNGLIDEVAIYRRALSGDEVQELKKCNGAITLHPTANAGVDQITKEGDLVTLNGSGSSDPDNGIASYEWTQISGPSVALSGSSVAQPAFTVPEVDQTGTTITFLLVVTDNGGLSSTDSCTVVVDNVPPAGTIEIGNNSSYSTTQAVTLSISSLDTVSMCFSNDGQTFTDWEAYFSSKNWELSNGDGQKTIYVKLRDTAGNISTVTHEILLDSTPPGAPILVDIGTTDNNEPLLDWEVVDNTKFYELEYGAGSDLANAERVEEIEPSVYEPTPFIDGTYYWRVRAIDDYGNVGVWSNIGSFTIDTSENCDTIILQPVLITPVDRATDISMEPTLTTSTFNDGGNCSGHWKTHWKINDRTDDFEGATTFNYISMDHSERDAGNSTHSKGSLTNLEVPALILEPGTTYYWKVRYHGDGGNKSDWSEVYSFTTQFDVEDQDDDGIPDDIEVDDDIDLNGDGISDNQQVGVIASVITRQGGQQVCIDVGDYEITKVDVMDDTVISDDLDRPDEMPFGLIGYKFRVNHFGETVTIKIHLSEPAPEGAKWVIYDKMEGWLDYSKYATFNEARDEVTLELKDGGYGDEDHTENKWIIDPSGVGVYADDAEASDSPSACFIGILMN